MGTRIQNRDRFYHQGMVPHTLREDAFNGICIHAQAADIGANWGVINENSYVPLAADDIIEVVAGAGDTTQWATLYGVKVLADGNYAIGVETKKLTAGTAVAFDNTYSIFLQGYLSARCANNVTWRRQTGATTIAVIDKDGDLSTNILHWYGADEEDYKGLILAGFGFVLDTQNGDAEIQVRAYPEATSARDLTEGFHGLTVPMKTDKANGVYAFERVNQRIFEYAEQGSYVAMVGRGYSGTSLYQYSDVDADLWLLRHL